MRYNNLYKGCTGNEVEDLQLALMKLGYDVGSTGADGHFGTKTDEAVRQFQRDYGITADGVAGQQTQTTLYGKIHEAIGKAFRKAYEDVCNLPSVRTLMELV